MKHTTYQTTRYELFEEGFYVEVNKPYDVYEFYLMHKNYDYKMFIGRMVGYATPSEQEEFVEREAYNFFTCYWSEVGAFDECDIPCGCGWEDFDKSMETLMAHDYVDAELNEGD